MTPPGSPQIPQPRRPTRTGQTPPRTRTPPRERTPPGERTPPQARRRVPPPRSDLAAHFRRRRRVAAVVLTAVLAIFAVGFGARLLLYDAGLADIEGVQVTGARTIAVAAVRDAAAVPIGVPLAGVDLAAVEARVERIAGVADAVAGRDWPHTVVIAVVERTPVAVADTPRGVHLVDDLGVAYLPAPDPAVLPRLEVGVVEPGAPPGPVVRAALDVLTALPPDLRKVVVAVEAGSAPSLSVTLRLTGNRQVRWGSPDRAAEKAAVLGPLLSQSGRVYDVVSPELPTIRR